MAEIMSELKWKNRIKKACEEAGTYRPFFDDTIATLAGILKKREEAEKAYERSGREPLVKHVNKGGAENLIKNPAIALWCELNRDALAYWRDLGLTPAGYKKLNEKQQESGFAEMMKAFGG